MNSNVVIPVIIPAYEPDQRLVPLLKALTEANITDIVIVDDGSKDFNKQYFELAKEEYGCIVLTHYENMGKGRALKDAFNFCLNEFPNMIGCVTADSDGQHTPEDIRKCMEVLKENPNHLILGCRDFYSDNVPKKSRYGNTITRRVCSAVCGVKVSDTQTGLRAIPKAFMAELLNTRGERFEFETNMLIDSKDKYPITEVPIETVYDSVEDHQTHFDPIKDSIRIYKIFGGRFVKFLFSSLSSSVIDLILFSVFCALLKPFDERALWYAAAATVCARVISATYNYLINYHLVFHSKESKGKALLKYVLLAAVQMSLSAGIVNLFVYFLAAPELPIKIVVDIILFLISFVIQRALVFKV